tara:strand:- start:559 stop:810 length:252 start_codon:yes stop_codon:yes gene_type:complete
MNIDTSKLKAGDMSKATTTAAHNLDNVTLTATKIDTMLPGELTEVMDQAAAQSWDAGTETAPWMKYALYGAAAYFIYKFVLKK